MKRKEGEKRRPRRKATTLVAGTVMLLVASKAPAGSLRLWPTAVVVGDAIRVDDVCELSGFSPQAHETLSQLIVGPAPDPGGSRAIPLELLRTTVAQSGTNMARVTVSGATTCEVSRPSSVALVPEPTSGGRSASHTSGRRAGDSDAADDSRVAPQTLRRTVVDFCNSQVALFGGKAEVTFDQTPNRLLELTAPDYQFRVRARGKTPLGLVPLEVDVIASDRLVQTVPLVVQVTMHRPVLVARRTVNQGAAVSSGDLELVELSFTRTDAIGMVDPAYAIGQQAKRMIPAGTVIQTEMLEPVPVVRRGQLVALSAVSGAIRIVTTAKAAGDGLVGDVIKVRSVEDRRVEYDAVVIGRGRVQMEEAGAPSGRVALGGGS